MNFNIELRCRDLIKTPFINQKTIYKLEGRSALLVSKFGNDNGTVIYGANQSNRPTTKSFFPFTDYLEDRQNNPDNWRLTLPGLYYVSDETEGLKMRIIFGKGDKHRGFLALMRDPDSIMDPLMLARLYITN